MKKLASLAIAATLPLSILYASPASAMADSPEVEAAEVANTQVVDDFGAEVTEEPSAEEAPTADPAVEEEAPNPLTEEEPIETSVDDAVTPEPDLKSMSSNGAVANSASNFVLPLPAKKYRLTSYFGNRCSPIIGARYYHDAVDMAAPLNTDTMAITDGTVITIGEANGSKTAGFITIDHGLWKGQRLTATYMHTWEASKYVKVGQKVKAGQVIAPVGSSGVSNGNHLHLAVRLDNKVSDLLTVMESAGVDIVGNATSVSANNRNVKTCNVYPWAKMGLKESANEKSKTLAVIEANTPLEITAGPDVNGYLPAKVIATGQKGYVFGKTTTVAMRKSPPAAFQTTSAPANVTYTYRSGYTYLLRDYPSKSTTDSGIIDSISGGTHKFVSTGRKTTGNWEEVKFNGHVGWVESAAFVKVADAPKPPTVKPPTVKPDSIAKGDIIVRNGKGQLLNYGNLNKKGKSPVVIGSGWGGFKSITATDFNADGVMDLVGNAGAKLYVYYGKKGGGFQAAKLIGSSGWANAELNAVKMRKTDKYPSLVVRFPNGDIFRYANNAGKSLVRGVKIGTGWKGFKQVTWGYVDKDGNIDAIAKDANGKLLLYRTNGSTFLGGARPVVGSGWKSYTMSSMGNTATTNGTATVAKVGQKLYHYTHSNGRLISTKLIGNGGWSPMYLVNQSI